MNGTKRCRRYRRKRRSPSSMSGPNSPNFKSRSSIMSPYGQPYKLGRYRSSLYKRFTKCSLASLNGTRRWSCQNGSRSSPNYSLRVMPSYAGSCRNSVSHAPRKSCRRIAPSKRTLIPSDSRSPPPPCSILAAVQYLKSSGIRSA